mgnify:CR=1 FL=1
MAKEVVVKASTIAKRKKRYQKTKLTISIVLLILIFSFIILSVIYKGGRFTITLDPRLSTDNRIVIYEDNEIKESKRKLVARDLDFMDNISIDWIPQILIQKPTAHIMVKTILLILSILKTKEKKQLIIGIWY